MTEAIALLARLIEFGGGLVILTGMARSILAIVAQRVTNASLDRARVVLAEAVVGALGLMTAATLLKTINLRTWSAIGLFAAVLALRTGVKWALAAEARRQPSLSSAAR